MFRPRRATFVVLFCCSLSTTPAVHGQKPDEAERDAMYYRYLQFNSYVKGGSIQPHWMADGSSFWYAEGAPANTVIWKVDPMVNTRTPLFDTARLRRALSPLLGHEPPYEGIPFEEFTFVGSGQKTVKFTLEKKEFILQLETYETHRGARSVRGREKPSRPTGRA